MLVMVTSRSQTERGHENPFIHQFSIFLSNRIGQLNELLSLLRDAKVQAAGISVVDSAECAVVRMIFTDPPRAREALTRHKIPFTECDALAVVLTDDDTLAEMLAALVAAELNVSFAYPLLIRRAGSPVLAFHVDDNVLAVHTLRKHGFTLLDHEDV